MTGPVEERLRRRRIRARAARLPAFRATSMAFSTARIAVSNDIRLTCSELVLRRRRGGRGEDAEERLPGGRRMLDGLLEAVGAARLQSSARTRLDALQQVAGLQVRSAEALVVLDDAALVRAFRDEEEALAELVLSTP